ncbi:ATP-binding protein [Paramagnetospirillum marisnigri]|nr:ATP-binding protein [Paramagnetospirillum marisnigri]
MPVAHRLLARLGVIGTVIALAISAIVVLRDYDMTQRQVAEVFEQIEASYLPSVTEHVWLKDHDHLIHLMDGIRHFPHIQLAETQDESGAVLAASGERIGASELVRRYELRRTYLGRSMVIGNLVVSANLEEMRLQATERAFLALLSNVVLIAGVLGALYWQVHRVVTRPLARMAAHARAQRAVRSDHLVPFPVPANMHNDELFDLASAYTELHLATQTAFLQVRDSESRLRILFDSSPVSLWEEDFSEVKRRVDDLRNETGADFDSYLSRHPERVLELAALVRVIDVNAATLALHAAPDRQALLGNLVTTFTPSSLDAFRRQLLAIWAGESEVEVEGEVQTLTGCRRQVVVHWAVPPGHTERLDRVIVALEDVTERKAAEQRLSETIGQLLQANAELARITEIASHDLQEPVRSVVSFSQLLERRLGQTLDDECRELLGYLMAAARRMRDQAQGLLAYARIGGVNAAAEPVALGEVVAEAVASLTEAIRDSRAVVHVAPLPEVVGDRAELVELFRQLLANALKFALPGIPPVVTVAALEDAKGAHVTVNDNGIGIAPTYAEDVFEVFRKLHGPDQYPGAGVGLAICRKIVNRHQGFVWVDRDRRDGCTVHVLFPPRPLA